MDPDRSQFSRGYVIALTSAAVLSTTAIFIRYLTQTYQIPSLVLAFWRDLFVPLCLLPLFGLLRPALLRFSRGHLGYLLAYGLVLAGFNASWTLSVALNGAAIATVLAYSSAAFTALLGRLLLKEHLGWGKILVVALSLGGCVLVSNALDLEAWSANVVGILSGLLSGLLYAMYSLMGRSAAQRGLNPWTTLTYTFAFAAGFLLIFNLLPGGGLPGAAARPAELFWLGTDLTGWGILVLLSIGPTVLGFGLYNVSLSLLPSIVVNLIATTEPVFTSVIAYFLLGERLTLVQILGGLMILGGVVFLRIYETGLAGRAQRHVKRNIGKSID
ncbi:MAG: EamA family transporter [Chloroflexota bacterium]